MKIKQVTKLFRFILSLKELLQMLIEELGVGYVAAFSIIFMSFL